MSLDKLHRKNRCGLRHRAGSFEIQCYSNSFGQDVAMFAYYMVNTVKEKPAKSNTGPLISAFRWYLKGKSKRDTKSAWCAYFASFCVEFVADSRQCGVKVHHSGNSVRMYHKNKNAGVYTYTAGDVHLGNAIPQAGDILVRTRAADDLEHALDYNYIKEHGIKGHTMLCVGYLQDRKTCLTIEGNTDPIGDNAEGGGVYQKWFPVSDSRFVGAIRPKVT